MYDGIFKRKEKRKKKKNMMKNDLNIKLDASGILTVVWEPL